MFAVAVDGFALLIAAATFEQSRDADPQRSQKLLGIVRVQTDSVIGKCQRTIGSVLLNVDSSMKRKIPTAPPHNGVVGILNQLPNWRVDSAVQRRPHDLNHASNIHPKRNLTSPHALHLTLPATIPLTFGRLHRRQISVPPSQPTG